MYANCPHQWRLAYHDKLKPNESSIHLVFGKAIHEAIQAWLDRHFNLKPRLSNTFDLEGLFKERLMHHFQADTLTNADGTKVFPTDKATLLEFYMDGLAILSYLTEHKNDIFPRAGHELVGVEIPLEMPLTEKLRFVGFIDIIVREKKTGKIIIYDLKTSGKGWFHEKKDPKKINQLLLYKRFYSKMFNTEEDNIRVEFVILKRKVDTTNKWNKRIVSFEPTHGTGAVTKATETFMSFVNEAFDAEGQVRVDNLPAKPSASACRFCPFKARKDLCPDGYYKETEQ